MEEVTLHHLNTHNPSLFALDDAPPIGLIGVDEVGRGCLAGPVVAGASLWLRESIVKTVVKHPWLSLIDDSKQMTPEKRNKCFEAVAKTFPNISNFDIGSDFENEDVQNDSLLDSFFTHLNLDSFGSVRKTFQAIPQEKREKFYCVGVEIGAASHTEIDAHNIWNGIQIAMGRSLKRLTRVFDQYGIDASNLGIVVDGKLRIRVPMGFTRCKQMTAVGADDRFLSVGLSSVVAKVARDRYMEEQGKLYPNFFFEKHKGYATAEHREALSRFEPTPIHRRSFLGGFEETQEISLL